MSLPTDACGNRFPRQRRARTPPSTFLFLPIQLSNSPGAWRNPIPPKNGEPKKLLHPNNYRMLGHCNSDELPSRRLARAKCAAPVVGVIGRDPSGSQHRFLLFCTAVDDGSGNGPKPPPIKEYPGIAPHPRHIARPFFLPETLLLRLRERRFSTLRAGVAGQVPGRPPSLAPLTPSGAEAIVPPLDSGPDGPHRTIRAADAL